MSSYKTLNDYLGREYIESERYGVYASKDDRDKFSWETGDDDTDYAVNITKTHLIIQDQVSFLGAQRSVRVPVRGGADGQAYCDKLERAITDLHRLWNMPRVTQEIAWYQVVYGTGVGVLQWDKNNKVPRLRVRSPESLYIQPSIDDDTLPQIAIFVYKTLGRSIIGDYPETAKKLDNDTEYDLVDYYSNDERVRFVGGENIELIRAKNPLGHVTVYLFPGILIPNSLWGASMLLRAIPPEKEINRLYSQQALYLRDAIEAPMVIHDPVNVPENARWNRDTTIEVGQQGKVGRANIASIDGRMLELRLRDMENNLNLTMDFSPILQGQAVGSYLTGKGVTSLQQPILQRLASKMQPVNPIYAQINKDALLLWNKAGGNASRTIFGEKSKSVFAEEFNPKQDIDPGYVENIVYLDTASFVDRTSARIASLQELGAGVMSRRRYMEISPDCDDVELELQHIREEKMEDIQMQMQMQQMAQMQAAQQPQTQPAQSGPESAENSVQATTPLGGPGGPDLGGSAKQEGQEPPGEEDILGSVAEVFRGIAKIKGQVFLVGEILMGGLTAEEIAASFLEVVISNPVDKQTILNGLRQTEIAEFVEQNKVVFHTNMGMLDNHPNIEVTPGTSGTEVNEGTPEPPGSETLDEINPEQMPPGAGPPSGAPPGGIPPEMLGMV